MKFKKNLDIFIFLGLVVILVIYALYIKASCEELGCLAVVIPIIGILIISIIEFFISLFLFVNKDKRILRTIILILTGIASLFAFYVFIISKF